MKPAWMRGTLGHDESGLLSFLSPKKRPVVLYPGDPRAWGRVHCIWNVQLHLSTFSHTHRSIRMVTVSCSGDEILNLETKT